MNFRIADTFTDSLARLAGDEQKAVKTTAFDLQINPANPGLAFHKLDKARDKNFWSVRVSGDIRLIVHRASGSLLLCYVDHHDRAYAWAERRKLEVHPQAGAVQLVEIRERIEWDKWTIFLHPAQRQWVEREFNGPARVCGSAGTGKTIVALHRAVFLARQHPESRVLLTTLSETLANALRTQLRRLISTEPRLAERLDVDTIDAVGSRLSARHLGPARLATDEQIRRLIAEASTAAGNQTFGLGFLRSEWTDLVDAWQLKTWDDYRDVKRLGRKTRLPESRRAALWTIFEGVRASLSESGLTTRAALLTDLATQLGERRQRPFEFVVVDEAQDLSVPQLRLLAALARRVGRRPSERTLLRGRPRSAHPAAPVLLAVPRSRHPRPRPNASDQLSHLASDPKPSGPPSRSGDLRCRRQHRRPPRYHLGLQRSGPDNRQLPDARRGGRRGRRLDYRAHRRIRPTA
ncbi:MULTISPECIES: UvrD-helicase domain-containing protein [unclassified Thiocapsa]|uniref:UvrD-helicase domain-containing protein n=1 Tax=unclassified Thiocapsa TaxID=2641286 RepID=UPI0035B41214